MEGRAFVAKAHVTGAKLPEIFSCFRHIFTVQPYHNTPSILVANLDVKIDLVCDSALFCLGCKVVSAYSCIVLQPACWS